MVKTIMGTTGLNITGTGCTGTYGPTVTGSIRWNGATQKMEVMDGLNWCSVPDDNVILSFSPEVAELLGWVARKKAEEKELDVLCENHPEIADLKQKLEIYKRLVKENI